jgi:transcriptional regulator with XRE-family HTH domain
MDEVSEARLERAFGDRIRAARESLGISQECLAERAQLHRTYVGSAERGERNVSLINILKLAHALDVSPGELLNGLFEEIQDK